MSGVEVFALPDGAFHDKTIYLQGPEADHIIKVCRHRPGDPITFSDGGGRFVYCVIDRASSHEVHARVERIDVDPREQGAPWLTLGLSLLKGDHFEFALEKAVELGVHRIVPILASRCVVKWKGNDAGKSKLQRWQRVAVAAMKQSGRSWLPAIESPVDLDALRAAVGDSMMWVVADETESQQTPADLGLARGTPVLGLVGPEGAFSDDEKLKLDDWGAHPVRLSSYRLRSETAAVALVAALA